MNGDADNDAEVEKKLTSEKRDGAEWEVLKG